MNFGKMAEIFAYIILGVLVTVLSIVVSIAAMGLFDFIIATKINELLAIIFLTTLLLIMLYIVGVVTMIFIDSVQENYLKK